MDEKYLEQAARLEEIDRANGIAKARASLRAVPSDFNRECVVCQDPIQEGRNATTCIECQEEIESLAARGIKWED